MAGRSEDKGASLTRRAIEAALRDGAAAYRERGVVPMLHLEARADAAWDDPVLHEAVYAIFRSLPHRLARGAILHVATHDRAGGDVELVWESREEGAPGSGGAQPLAQGPLGDLLSVAILGLEEICRARSGHFERTPEDPVLAAQAAAAGEVRRRFLFLVPGPERGLRGPYAR